MPHLRDDAPSARKLRRPVSLLVATLSSCGKKIIMPGGSPVKNVASRKNGFFALGVYRGLNVAGFKGSVVTPENFRKPKKRTKEFTHTDRKPI
jgi:hypothetical protein